MADKKISALTASTTPLAGTEVLPIVQGGETRKVSVADLTAGRSISVAGLTSTAALTANPPSSTFASLPAASGASGQIYRVTDVGANGTLWQSDGSAWELVNGVSYIYQMTVPFIISSSGSFGNNGALSGITALSRLSGPCYMWFPANAIAAGIAAGWYYAVLGSSTTATVYNNTYTSGQPRVPASPTAFATTGPGAFTQSNPAATESPQFTLVANTLGRYGTLQFDYKVNCNSSANFKTVGYRLDNQALINFVRGTTITGGVGTFYTVAGGALNDQMTYTSTASSIQASAKNTAADIPIYFYMAADNASDTVTLESIRVMLQNV